MKKFIIAVASLIVLYLAWDYAYFHMGIYINFGDDEKTETFMAVDEDTIYMLDKETGRYEPFEIKGVDMGSGKPGEWSTDFAVTKETYLRWFAEIQEMGANTVRVYTIQADDFYNAFYAYNHDREEKGKEPLWLIQGVWVNDYVQNSDRDAYDDDFMETLMDDCRTMVNVIHGQQKLYVGRVASAGSGTYLHDISGWVIGYILGVEWEDVTVAYTDHKYEGINGYTSFTGDYMYTTEEATPFECMLARVGDKTIEYETNRFHTQRLVAFSNWPTTDPFHYADAVEKYFMKCAEVDVEHIETTDAFLAGQFASYHVYPYYPDYLQYDEDWAKFHIEEKADYYTKDGKLNTYRAYLRMLTNHHTMPVVISEFGVSTGRGMAQYDANTGRNQGHMSEKDQGDAIVQCYEDIRSVGCAGCCVFTWQDEWFKRTWNTMYAVDLKRNPYWSDYQTNEQYFGFLSFDPGNEKSVCYVDGDLSEWTKDNVVIENRDMALSMKYDEKFIYFLIEKNGLDFDTDTLFVPIDTTPKSGSTYCENNGLLFERPADFLIVIDGKENSRVLVQERYESLRSTYAHDVYGYDTYLEGNIPAVDSPVFVNINLVLQTQMAQFIQYLKEEDYRAQTFETGALRYGNANPDSPDFDSLADFICTGDFIELKLPWQLLNFADPSRMEIHDDYYDGNYGVEYIDIDEMYVGIAGAAGPEGTSSLAAERILMNSFSLKGWGNKVTSHERLKSSYYILQGVWANK